MVGSMKVLDSSGHTTLAWGEEAKEQEGTHPVSEKEAAKQFVHLRDQGYLAFLIETAERGVLPPAEREEVKEFVPDAEILMLPRFQGG